MKNSKWTKGLFDDQPYCPYHRQSRLIALKKLMQVEIRA